MIEKLYCDSCNKWIIPVEGVTSIYINGYHWCANCANIRFIDEQPSLVDFPSPGKLIPKTILTEGEMPMD